MNRRKPLGSLLLSACILLLTAVGSLFIGGKSIAWSQLFRFWGDPSSIDYIILSGIRIPRMLTAIAIGGGLSLCGAILQGLFRNPLVEPYTLGVSGGASLGVTIAIVTGLTAISSIFMPLLGFLGALATIFIVYLYSYRRRNFSINRMLLVGVMLSFIASSAVMFMMSVTSAENLQKIVFRTMGSLSENRPILIVSLLITSILVLCASFLFATPLNALRIGEQKAQQLGVNTQKTTQLLFLLTSILTGFCISVSGVIGFVGLIIPHISRQWIGWDYRFLLFASFLNGASFLLLCDLIARTIVYPNELPVGVVTGIIGGVFFIYLINKSKDSYFLD
ncbi:MAG: iron ABC transporter permease [Porphyromonas sp.]|nr:iron ABC transporter permease [Porphyromonas sp.]